MRKRILLCILFTCCTLLAGCGGGKLTITISGLPATTPASVTISHTGVADRVITSTTTLSNQPAGTYTVTAANVSGYTAPSSPQTVSVVNNKETVVAVAYSAAPVVPPPGNVFGTHTNFESPQTNPIRLSSSGTRLFAVNTDLDRVSVFSLSAPQSPARIAEIPVGIGPVSLWPKSEDEVWVVNQLSDSISVVSVSLGIVSDTIPCGDEPADIVMVGNYAYVTVARAKEVRVFDATTHALVTTLPLQGEYPRALAVSPDASKVYVAFGLSGNHSTIVARNAKKRPTQPAPVSGLPPIPGVGLIVDASDPAWTQDDILFTLLDHDVAEISTSTRTLTRYFDKVGTINFNLAVNPVSGDVFVANTNAKNMGPAGERTTVQSLRANFVDNRITRISTGSTPLVTPFDLNPGVNAAVLPNAEALATALAQPSAVVFDPSGKFMWIAALGTDRIAKVDINGNVLARIEIGNVTGSQADPEHKRGPHGLALSADGKYLYVQNRISNSLSVIETETASLKNELGVGAFDPTPTSIKEGRGYLYDAKLSGNGLSSCASCHVDGDVDGLAWDLSDPKGSMVNVFDPISNTYKSMHPMKGPMVTQSLGGLKGLAPYHWRGDIADINATNHNFSALMGGAELSAGDMQKLTDFIESIALPPNPYLLLDRSYPATINGKSPALGLAGFQAVPSPVGDSVACSSCHSLPTEAFKLQITKPVGGNVDFKVPLLRHVYKKTGYQTAAGATSTLGFGQTGDGAVAHEFGNTNSSFLLAWDSGTAPAVGYTRTFTSKNVTDNALVANWETLEKRAAAGDNDVVVRGVIEGTVVGFVYAPTESRYLNCSVGGASLTHAELLGKIAAGATLSVMGTPPEEASCGLVGF